MNEFCSKAPKKFFFTSVLVLQNVNLIGFAFLRQTFMYRAFSG